MANCNCNYHIDNMADFVYNISMIQRHLSYKLKALAAKFPVILLTGPRQAGKTTLAKYLFPNHAYVSLEDPITENLY